MSFDSDDFDEGVVPGARSRRRAKPRRTGVDASATHSEIELRDQFAQENPDWRYCEQIRRWYHWSGRVWESDQTSLIRERVTAFAAKRRDCLAQSDARLARKIGSNASVAAILSLVRHHLEYAANTDVWDPNDTELNCPDGIYDLRTLDRRPHDPGKYHTKITSCAPADGVPTDSIWYNFISDICWDGELARYLKQAAGYSITGLVREECFFFLHGPGANGKSKLLGAIAGALGTYHQHAGIETFTEQSFAQHPTDLASLWGARFVTAVETEDGRRWAEARIKSITGGDPISARFMRQDFFTFTPKLKLWIAGNHRPTLRNVDEAMRRRVHLIPFERVIPAEERDLQLAEKLRKEEPIILRWLLEGARDWFAQRLSAPAIVRDATDQYLQDEDTVGRWIEERCNIGEACRASFTDLWFSWKEWAERGGERPGSKKRLGKTLQDKGFSQDRTGSGRYYKGLEPCAAPQS